MKIIKMLMLIPVFAAQIMTALITNAVSDYLGVEDHPKNSIIIHGV